MYQPLDSAPPRGEAGQHHHAAEGAGWALTDVQQLEGALKTCVTVMAQHEYDALVSFSLQRG